MGRQRDPLTAVRWIIDGLLLAVVLAVVAAFVVARGLPAIGHETLVVNGRSMEPAVPFGSMAVLEEVQGGSVRSGDVVSVGLPDGGPTLTHRVVEVIDRDDGRWLRIKGDANAEPDPALVSAGWLLGRVAVVIPWLGFVVLLLSSVTGMLMVLSLSLALYVAARLVEDLEWERARVRRALALAASSPAPDPQPGADANPAGPPTHAPAADPARRRAAALRRERRGARLRRWQA
jgi:signal peptidase